jgi:hypothetical protein
VNLSSCARGGRWPVLCILVVVTACEARGPGAAPAGGGAPPTPGAAGPESPPVRRVRRLSSREYNNVVRDLLGDTTRPADGFLIESHPHGFDNGPEALGVQIEQAAAFQKAAEALAASAVAGDLGGLLDGCDVAARGAPACRAAFLAGFPRRAFRRPLTEPEAERVAAVFDAGAASEGFAGGVQLAVELLLQSPQFLYREELGPIADPAAPTVRLGPFEIASQLSFLLTGTMPDPALFRAAENGELETADQVRAQALRLLSTERARETMRALIFQWLAVDHLDALSKNPTVYPSFTPALAAAMQRDLEAVVDWKLWGSEGSLAGLFTATAAFVDRPLARLYGLESATPPGPVNLDPATRAGLLTRAAFLAAHAAPDGGGPVARGVFVISNLLCREIPQPPPDAVNAQPVGPEGPLDLTSRPGVAVHSSDPRCRTCHAAIDGIGFGFEEFDGIGAHRTHYRDGKPVDSSGELLGTDVDGPFTGVAELSARLAASEVVRECFARQLYRFGMGAIEPASFGGARGYELGMGTRITDALVNLVGRETFFVRGAR